jgi:hypothetical protein
MPCREFNNKTDLLSVSQSSRDYHVIKPVRIIMGFVSALILLTAAQPIGAAETQRISPSSISPATAEACLPLLDSVRQSSPSEAVVRNQRNAGKLAVLGLALGVRYALQPPSGQGNAPVYQETYLKSVKAAEILKYRKCIKMNALHVKNKADLYIVTDRR